MNVFGICSSLDRIYSLGVRDTLILLHLKLITLQGDLDSLREVGRMLTGFITYPEGKKNPWAQPTLATSWEDSKAKRWALIMLSFYKENHMDVVKILEKEAGIKIEEVMKELT